MREPRRGWRARLDPTRAYRWARRRLQNRPDSEHEQTLNRFFLIGAGLAYAVFVDWTASAEAQGLLGQIRLALFAHTAVAVGLLAHMLVAPREAPERKYTAIVCDLALLSYFMHLGGERGALLYPIYLWTIFGNGFRFGNRYLLAAAVFGAFAFAVVIATTPMWLVHPQLAFGLLLGLIILPAYVAVLINKLSKAKAQAEEASRAKSAFLASVSHELRTPLNAIIGLSDLVGATKLDASQRDMNATIGSAGRSLLGLITSILDFSRLEVGKFSCVVAEFDLHALLLRSCDLLTVQARQKGIRLSLHIEIGTPGLVLGSARHWEEALINLVGNAVKFTERGFVLVRVSAPPADSNRVRVEVTDTGIGIAADAQARIFESFTQANDRIIDQYGGTGLGLAITKLLVESQAGALGVISAPGQGSTFWFEMDCPPAAASRPGLDGAAAIVVSRDDDLVSAVENLGAHVTRCDAALAPALFRASLAREGAAAIVIVDEDAAEPDVAALAGAIEAESPLFAPATILVRRGGAGRGDDAGQRRYLTAIDGPVRAANLADALEIAHARRREQKPPASRDQGGAGAPAASVLVAEDNGTNQKVIGRILESAGHAVTIVSNGRLAVEALAAGRFDIVLMDINMPVLNGIEATRLHRFASGGRDRTPIIALTADATDETRARCLEAGMDDCLTKPIDPAALLALIARTCAGTAADPPVSDSAPPQTAEARPRGTALDEEALANLEALGGPAFVDEIGRQFLHDAAKLLQAMREAAETADAEGFRDQAHALRSCAANIGARSIFDLCLGWRTITAERLASEGREMTARLAAELVEAGDALTVHLARARAA